MPGGSWRTICCAWAFTWAMAASIGTLGWKYSRVTATPRSDTDSRCSIPLTVVVNARSLTVTIRSCISVGDSPE